jgi:alkylation response protein AidB-like acyl-CoA dehydrogenase
VGALDFTVDMEDIKFVLFEQLNLDKDLAEIERYAEFDRETYITMLDAAEQLATEVLAPLNGPSDQEGCKFDPETNSVTTPPGFKDAWEKTTEGMWVNITATEEFGGIGAPATLQMAVNELFSGSCMSFAMYPGLTAAAARMLENFGNDRMKAFATQMNLGEMTGTMCLTEADAGSAVGDNRCKAHRTDEDGIFLLEGEKIFISNADHDLTENIMHLILARTPDAPSGIKGLSLLVAPKYWINEDGSTGDRNAANVVGIEHKMGIHGSATCTLALGDTGPCKAWLLGEEQKGIALMFNMMNEARIGVGSQGQSMAAAAYQYALNYCKERLQGTSLKDFKNPDAPRVAINQHADVRRMLMTMKCQVEAMRSLIYRLGHRHDVALNCGDKAKHDKLLGRVDLLVPIVKAYCTDVGFDVTVTALQCLGGYGYIGEYPVEQLVRDCKVGSIYEGTNGIQAMDLLGRKLRLKGGALFMEWLQDAQKNLAAAGGEGFGDEAAAIGKAVNNLGASAMKLGGLGAQGKLETVMSQAVPFQKCFGNVLLALETLDQARVAKRIIERDGETPHLASKALNLKFYTANILPEAVAIAKAVQNADDSCLDERLFN